ncbi:hypothetical protein L7F22_044867 [Adiantum nelumboides]|nr:hypothetical protein [Adiantum nelumboides]
MLPTQAPHQLSPRHYDQYGHDPGPSSIPLANRTGNGNGNSNSNSNGNVGYLGASSLQAIPPYRGSPSTTQANGGYNTSLASNSAVNGQAGGYGMQIRSPTESSMPTTAASLMREGPRDFTVIKDVGDGSFGNSVSGRLEEPAAERDFAQSDAASNDKTRVPRQRLVAIKKMKKPFSSWDECMKLKELKDPTVILAIPHHPNIIPLYDAFLMPGEKKMLHFVFECMEGNLYQLTKSRKGRPLASGLVASIFQQIIRGLHHIHEHGYFHRDMKQKTAHHHHWPCRLPAYAPFAPRGTAPERDVLVIVKLADFGLARETQKRATLHRYVSTRWYRAPEILLRARDYSSPVDIWAWVPSWPSSSTSNRSFLAKLRWTKSFTLSRFLVIPRQNMAKTSEAGYEVVAIGPEGCGLLKRSALSLPDELRESFFGKVPAALVDCIQDMMRYEPQARLTTRDCLNHVYYREIAPKLLPLQAKELAIATEPTAQLRQVPRAQLQPIALPDKTMGMDPNAGRRQVPPSHSAMPQSVRPAFGAGTSAHDMARLQQQQDQPMAAASPMRTGPTHDTGPVDAPMDAASPKELNDVQWAPAPGSGVRDSTISQISQYPAFPDSASLYAGSHASMQFDDVSLRPPQAYQGEAGSDAQFSTSTVRDVRQYNPQVQRNSAAMPPRRPEEEQWVNRQAQQGLPAQTQDNASDLADSNASNETLGSRDRRRSKTWGLNISSVFTGNSSGSGPVPKQPTGQQWDPTPAQQLVAEQQPQFLTSQAQQQAAYSSASLPNSAPVQSSNKPLDRKRPRRRQRRRPEKRKRPRELPRRRPLEIERGQ